MSSAERDHEWQRRAQPLNYPLPATFQWVAALPRAVRPMALLELFPRIANVLAQSWNDSAALRAYMDSLLADRRGGRRGFPAEINRELQSLLDFIASRNGEQRGRVGLLVKAIQEGESPANLSGLVVAHLSAERTLADDDFMVLRAALGQRMDEAGFGTHEWDAYEVILEILEDAHERTLRGTGETPIGNREGSAAYLIDRILRRAVTIDEEGRAIYDPSRVSRLVALAEEKGLLFKLGAKGEELRSLGDLGELVGAQPPKGNPVRSAW
jgi:hypothetical protein